MWDILTKILYRYNPNEKSTLKIIMINTGFKLMNVYLIEYTYCYFTVFNVRDILIPE